MRRMRGEPKPGETGPPKPKGISYKEWTKKVRDRFASGGSRRAPDVDEPESRSGRGYWKRAGLGKYRPGG